MLLLTLLDLQAVVGMSARGAGLAIALSPVVLAAVAPASGRLIGWMGAKALLVSGFVLYALGILAIALVIGTATTWWQLVPGLVLVGVGGAVTGTPLAMIAMRDVEPAVVGAASGLFSTTRLAGSLIGSAAVGAMLQARLSQVRIDPDLVTAGQIPPGSREGFAEAIQTTYLLPAIALVAGALLALAAKNTAAAPVAPEPAAELSAAES
jgi:MFS family permease